MLGLVQSMKNNLAPINRIPPDVFFRIPEYLDGDDDDDDQNLIAMTHVCRSWRELLITRPSLWALLPDCQNTDRTRVYIERSKSAPLELFLYQHGDTTYLEEAFLSVVPHIGRLKSLRIKGDIDLLQNLTPHLSCPTPLLKQLSIDFTCDPPRPQHHTFQR